MKSEGALLVQMPWSFAINERAKACVYMTMNLIVTKVESMQIVQYALTYIGGLGYIEKMSHTSEIISLGQIPTLPSLAHVDRLMPIKDNIKDILKLNAFGSEILCNQLARHEYACKYVNERAYLRQCLGSCHP